MKTIYIYSYSISRGFYEEEMESNENIFVMYQKCNHMKFIGVIIYNFAPMDNI